MLDVLKEQRQRLENQQLQLVQNSRAFGGQPSQSTKAPTILPAVRQRNFSNTRFEQTAHATATKDSIKPKEEAKKKTLFTSVHTPTRALMNKVNEHLTGKREIRGKAAKPDHLKLSPAPESKTSLSRNSQVFATHQTRTIDAKVPQPIFKEVPFWSNLNEESPMTSAITATAQPRRHHNSTLPADGVLPSDSRRSIFH